MALTPEQQDALQQLWAITASSTQASRERDERLLAENGWNVQSTVEQIFNMPAASSSSTTILNSPSTSSRTIEQLQVDETLSFGMGRPPRSPGQGSGRRPSSGPRRRPSSGPGQVGLGLWRFVSVPLSLLWTIVGGVWYFFIRTFIPLSFLPHLPRYLLPPSSAPPKPPQDATTASRNFVRDLETFTGKSCATGTLPDFWVGGYRDFLANVRREGKVGLVILCSSEHEDDEEFKRDVLCDDEFVRCLKANDILVWGADIRSREGYQVSQTLLVTTFPSLTFVSLLPAQSSSTPRLNILTTISGHPATSTSTSTLLQTITTSILPRTSAFLSRLRRERATLEEARHLREEQDRAFRDAERKDREKTRAAEQQRELERIKKERTDQAVRDKAELRDKTRQWRRYARKHLLPPSEGPIRVAMRTPLNAERNIRFFNPSASTEVLFVFAETLLIPATDLPADDPDAAPAGFEPASNVRLVTTFPRLEIERVSTGGEAIWETVKKAGGALVAEKKEGTEWCDAEIRDSRTDSDDEDAED